MVDKNTIFSFLTCVALTSVFFLFFGYSSLCISFFVVICFTAYKRIKRDNRFRKSYYFSVGNLLYLEHKSKITLSEKEKNLLLKNFENYSFSNYVKVAYIQSKYL